MTSSPLKIRLLGPVEITDEGQPLKIKRRLERAILYYLAAENRPVSRTGLIDLLWRDQEGIDHRGALRTALSRLRSELSDENILQTELDQVWLDESRCWSDLSAFKSSFESLKNVLRAYQKNPLLPGQIVEQIEGALALWRGDAILQGDNLTAYPEIDSWQRSLNRSLSHQRGTLMEKLARHYLAAGELERALELYLKLGKMDLFDVMVHLSVLDILTRMRRFQEVVDYCDSLEIAYEREYNAPLPEPILQHYQYSQIQLKASQEQQTVDWPVSPTMHLPLVGREKELAQLQKTFFGGGIAVIQGELGSGKTRLVQEFYQTSQPTPRLFYAPSQEMMISLPLSPVIHGFRHHVSRDLWESIDSVWANRLGVLLPEMAEYRDDCSPSQSSSETRANQQLFDAILHVFQTLAEGHQRILFFLDDAQWVDRQTLEALGYLVMHRFFEQHGCLVIACRNEEPNPDLIEMLDRLHRTHRVQNIQLNGLSPQDLSTLTNQALDEPASQSFIDQLYRETNGNPFLALEIIRNLLEFPGENEQAFSGANLPLPENVHAVIRKRLNSLDEQARLILLYAAVIGKEFSADFLGKLIDSETGLPLAMLDPLIEFGFLQPLPNGSAQKNQLQFAHAIMREVVLKEASALQLRDIHQRIADFLAKEAQVGPQAILIANHYRAAGQNASAFHWYIRAAAHAWSLGAREETRRMFLQAEGLYNAAPGDLFAAEDVLELYRQWALFAYESDQIDLLEEVGLKLQYLGEQEHDPLLLGVANMSLANACFLRMKMETGLALINKAIEYLQHTGRQQVMIEAKLRQAAFFWWLMDFDATIQTCQEVLEMGEALGDSQYHLNQYLFFARHNISYSYYAKGNALKALSYATETYDRYFHQLSTFNRMRTFQLLANTNLIAANYEKCQIFAEKGLEITQIVDNAFVAQVLLGTQSKSELIQGYLDEAFEHASQALQLGEENRHAHTIITTNCILGDIYFSLQEYTLALQHYRVAQLRAGYANESIHQLENDLHLSRALAWMGQAAEAEDLAKNALAVTEKKGMLRLQTEALRAVGLCAMLMGRPEESEGHYLRSEGLAIENGLIYEALWSKVGRARLALSRRQFEAVKELVCEVIQRSQANKMAWLTLYSLQMCAHLHHATDDPSLLKYRASFTELLAHLSEHTQSTPLRQYLESAQEFWERGHAYP